MDEAVKVPAILIFPDTPSKVTPVPTVKLALPSISIKVLPDPEVSTPTEEKFLSSSITVILLI
jgi:hypothetical protein